MPTISKDVLEESVFVTAADWSVSHGRHFRATIIIWGMRKQYFILEVRTILADANFSNFARGEMRWEGDHLRVLLTVHDSKAIDKSIVSELSAKLRKTGCRCVLDNGRKELVRCSLLIACSNRFRSLKDDDVTIKKRDCVGVPQGGLQSRSAYYCEYRLLVVPWNFSGLCSQRKQKKVSEVLNKLKLDIVAAQESWEREDSVIEVQGYKWLSKPRKIQNSKRGEVLDS